jgi:hypothetical protein
MNLNTDVFERNVNLVRFIKSELRKTKAVPSIRAITFSLSNGMLIFDSRCKSDNHTTMRSGVPRRVSVHQSAGHLIVKYAPTHRFIGPILEPPDEVVFGGNEQKAEKSCAKFIATYLASGKVKLL